MLERWRPEKPSRGVYRVASNRLFQILDVYWRSPESGDVWYKSRQLKKTVWYRDAGALEVGEAEFRKALRELRVRHRRHVLEELHVRVNALRIDRRQKTDRRLINGRVPFVYGRKPVHL